MTDSKKKTPCANEECRRPAEEGSRFCSSCGLEWALFHREARPTSAAIKCRAEMTPDMALKPA